MPLFHERLACLSWEPTHKVSPDPVILGDRAKFDGGQVRLSEKQFSALWPPSCIWATSSLSVRQTRALRRGTTQRRLPSPPLQICCRSAPSDACSCLTMPAHATATGRLLLCPTYIWDLPPACGRYDNDQQHLPLSKLSSFHRVLHHRWKRRHC